MIIALRKYSLRPDLIDGTMVGFVPNYKSSKETFLAWSVPERAKKGALYVTLLAKLIYIEH